MSESYPYFSISRQFGVPYGEVLAMAEAYRKRGIEAVREGPTWAAVREAVIAEIVRREKVILTEAGVKVFG